MVLSFSSTSSTLDAFKWILISIAFSILPVYLIILYLVHSGEVDAVFTPVRGQRTKIYLPAGLCTVAGIIVLYYLGAPTILVAAFVAALSTIIIFTVINLWWKISVHTGSVAATATILIMLYGWAAAVTVLLIPATAWARTEMKHHSPAQVAGGALLAAAIVAAVFYPLALA